MRALICCLVLVAAAPARADEPPPDAAVRDAIVAAVRARMGEGADVAVAALRLPPGWSRADVQVRPDPRAVLGRPMRFSLGTPSARRGGAIRWTGAAEADVQVLVEHLHTTRAVARGDILSGADVAVVRHAVEGPLRAWPAAEAIDRSRALRDFGPGACLARNSLAVVSLVRAGQDVQAIARVGGIEAEARMVAAENGDKGSVIRVVNPESRRSIRARVVAAGVVEVIHD